MKLPRGGIATALLVPVLACIGCQGEEAQKAQSLEKVQAKFERGREEAAKVIEKGATSRGPAGVPKRRMR